MICDTGLSLGTVSTVLIHTTMASGHFSCGKLKAKAGTTAAYYVVLELQLSAQPVGNSSKAVATGM